MSTAAPSHAPISHHPSLPSLNPLTVLPSVASLFPPHQQSAPLNLLPSPRAAVLGPLPPTAPLHLALAYLSLCDLPEYTNSQQSLSRSRALIVTGPRAAWQAALEDDDEKWMRDHGGDYTVHDKLARVDMRYCPTREHARLLLTLLTTGTSSNSSPSTNPIELVDTPRLIILYDLARLFVAELEPDENIPPEQSGAQERVATRFAWDATAAGYLDLIAAASDAALYLTHTEEIHKVTTDKERSTDTGSVVPATTLVVLEPSVRHDAALPILAAGSDKPNVPPTSRDRTVALADGLRSILGPDSVVTVHQVPPGEQADAGDEYYEIKLGDRTENETMNQSTHNGKNDINNETKNESIKIRRVRCGRAEFAVAPKADQHDSGDELDLGGWTWVWT